MKIRKRSKMCGEKRKNERENRGRKRVKVKAVVAIAMASFFLVSLVNIETGFDVNLVDASPGANTNYYWNYYKVLYINNANNSYQMFINVSKDSGGDVSCNGHCKDDFGDIRFLDGNNVTVLDYWIEKKVDGWYAWFWVELPSDVETDQKILIYYNNPDATSISNGSATFLWFDDFTTNTSGDWEKIESEHPEMWNFHYTKFNTPLHAARLRCSVDCVDINSRNWGGHIYYGMKVENNTDYHNRSTLMHSYNSDRGASETQPASYLHTFSASNITSVGGEKVMVEGANGYVTEWLYSCPDNILRGKIWDSLDNLLCNKSVSSNIPDNLTYLYFEMIDRHGTNGGDGSSTGLFYDAVDEQLIAYCKGSHYSEDDSWLELHFSWMFLAKYLDLQPSVSSIGDEQPIPLPATVYADDDFNSYTPGWGYDHFDKIQDGINAVAEGGTVYVFNGIYYENVIMNKRINLIGEDKNTTIIDGGGTGDVNVSADWVNVSNFKIQNNSIDGIRLYYSNNITISDNIILDCYDGISLDVCNNSNIIGNTVTNHIDDGITLKRSNNNTILGNTVSSNNDRGFSAAYSDNNIVYGNVISDNDYGIYLYWTNNNNLFYHNNIISNIHNHYFDYGTNSWDNGYPSGGNYWSDYTGSDADGDGIGDTPYNISGNSNQDRYPLMNPWNITINQPPTVEITYPYNGATVSDTITISGTASDSDGTVQSVQIKIDSDSWHIASGTTSWSYSWDTTTVSDGSHTIYARSYDGSYYSSIDSVGVAVDNVPPNQPPIVSISSPSDGATVSDTVTISGTASDSDGTVQKVKVKIDSGSWYAASGTTSWSYTWDTTKVSNGYHTISARSYDGKDYSTIDSINVTVNNPEPQKPDLYLSKEDISFSDQNPPVGNTITIYALIHNRGKTDGTATVKFYDGNPETAENPSEILIGMDSVSVVTYETDTAFVTWTATPSGNHTIHVLISNCQPSEETEDNNIANNTIIVGVPQQLTLVITLGVSNIAPFEEDTSRTIPVTIYCYNSPVNNVYLQILEDANLTITPMTPNLDLNPGDKIDYLIKIRVPKLDENVTLGSKTIVVQAVGDDGIMSNAESIDILIHEPGKGIPSFTTTAAIASAGIGALLAFFRRRNGNGKI